MNPSGSTCRSPKSATAVASTQVSNQCDGCPTAEIRHAGCCTALTCLHDGSLRSIQLAFCENPYFANSSFRTVILRGRDTMREVVRRTMAVFAALALTA